MEQGKQQREEKKEAVPTVLTQRVKTGRSYAAVATDLLDMVPSSSGHSLPPPQPGVDVNMINLIMSLIHTLSKLTDKVDKLVALVMLQP